MQGIQGFHGFIVLLGGAMNDLSIGICRLALSVAQFKRSPPLPQDPIANPQIPIDRSQVNRVPPGAFEDEVKGAVIVDGIEDSVHENCCEGFVRGVGVIECDRIAVHFNMGILNWFGELSFALGTIGEREILLAD